MSKVRDLMPMICGGGFSLGMVWVVVGGEGWSRGRGGEEEEGGFCGKGWGDRPWMLERRVPWLFRIVMWLWRARRLLLFGSRRSGWWDSAILSNTGSAISKEN